MKEYEIRPKKIFDEYLRLAKEDIQTYFTNVKRTECDCPACGFNGEHTFSKNGFDYAICKKCCTLYVSPRPEENAFTRYYIESPSSKYWASTFYKATADARRVKIWKPKAALIANIIKQYGIDNYTVVDIGGGYGIFAEEIQQYTSKPVCIIEPAPHLAVVCREKGFIVIEKFLKDIMQKDLPESPRLFVSFELFEHLYSPKVFLKQLYNLMDSGDFFIFTTLSGAGIDIQLLWENSKSVSPPHHLNFFNPKSVEILLKRLDFETKLISTPGKLDLDILYNNRDLIKDRFWKYFLENADDEVKNKWQNMISETGWSSHMMVVCRKA